ncbi:UNVERIFIED_CONTAM: hypothetical protein GTU68_022280 [Idotea baltica]|nr:hypothetical protein [Idotea baltica]
MEVIQLNQDHLTEIAKQVSCPSYDRQALKTGIVHIGVGGFHRSHQAYYIHQLLEKYHALDWGICGVGLREADRNIYKVLKKQDCLYTLIVQHPNGEVKSEVIGALKEFLLAVDTPDLVIDKMAHPDTKIVSLTITEGGYNFNSNTGDFDFENPDIQHELQHSDRPKTVFGFLTAALKKRKANGLPPFSILSCDNIQHNGDMTRRMLLAFTQKQNPELAEWIEKEVSFPNTMVDRITPVTTPADIDYLKNTHHIIDEWPVICEPFIQWVVEDKFSNGRPPLEKLGVQFVPDVSPYEKMKIRLLNAGHSVLGIPGAIHGHPTINACMNDPVFATFMRQFMDKEASPVLDAIEGIDLEKYKDSLEERFANPNIKDSVGRICSESSAKLPKFLIPTILENLTTGGSIKYGTLILAVWCYYSDKETNENNEPLEILDARKTELHQAAKNTLNDPLSFLSEHEIFGDIIDNQRFVNKYKEMIQFIYQEKGIRKLMEKMI